jgi:hypothetical protein
MTQCNSVLEILKQQGIDPDKEVQTDAGERTAFDVLEGAINGALEEIEEGSDS